MERNSECRNPFSIQDNIKLWNATAVSCHLSLFLVCWSENDSSLDAGLIWRRWWFSRTGKSPGGRRLKHYVDFGQRAILLLDGCHLWWWVLCLKFRSTMLTDAGELGQSYNSFLSIKYGMKSQNFIITDNWQLWEIEEAQKLRLTAAF